MYPLWLFLSRVGFGQRSFSSCVLPSLDSFSRQRPVSPNFVHSSQLYYSAVAYQFHFLLNFCSHEKLAENSLALTLIPRYKRFEALPFLTSFLTSVQARKRTVSSTSSSRPCRAGCAARKSSS